jgi:hypothetical protein
VFPNYKAASAAAVCYLAATMPEVQRATSLAGSGSSISVVSIESKPGYRDTRGSAAAGTWCPKSQAVKGANPISTSIHVYNTPVTMLHSLLAQSDI